MIQSRQMCLCVCQSLSIIRRELTWILGVKLKISSIQDSLAGWCRFEPGEIVAAPCHKMPSCGLGCLLYSADLIMVAENYSHGIVICARGLLIKGRCHLNTLAISFVKLNQGCGASLSGTSGATSLLIQPSKKRESAHSHKTSRP